MKGFELESMDPFERFNIRDLSDETSLLDLYDRYLDPPEFSEEDRQAYQQYAKERTVPIVLTLLWFLLGLTVLSLATDPWVFRNRPTILRGMSLVWGASLVLSVSGLLDYYFGQYFVKHYPDLTGIVIGVSVGLGVSISTGLIGRIDFPFFYAVYLIPFVTAFLLGLSLRERILSTLIVTVSCLVGYFLYHPVWVTNIHFFSHVGLLNVSTILSIGGGHIIYDLFRRSFLQERKAERERQRSEALLLNVLPEDVVDELKEEQQVVAHEYDQASVVFADLVDFTTMTDRQTPERIVSLLNDVFSEFDLMVRDHGVEKIKTIGDAYMVASGLPERRNDHATVALELATEMMERIEDFDNRHEEELQLRIGIHSGPVMAGVIGLDKFIYDLWGNTVNVASRLESQGVPGGIQVSSKTRELTLRHSDGEFEFQKRGIITVKGKGEMTTYFVDRN